VFEDKGDTCESTQRLTETDEIDETYRVEGGTLTTLAAGDASPEPSEFCVEGDTLTISTIGDDGATLRWQARRR